MEESRIHILFSKYLKKDILKDEFIEFRNYVKQMGHAPLSNLITSLWEDYEINEAPSADHIEKIISTIIKQTKPKPYSLILQNYRQIAASIILILLCSFSAYLYIDREQTRILGEQEVIVNVAKGQRVGIVLPDGTNVNLNSESVLSYRQNFGKEERRVNLTGEGFFEVTKNPEKKFIVHTEYLNIEVLGTIFNMYAYEKTDKAELALVSGKVKISTIEEPIQTVHLNASEKATFDKRLKTLSVEKKDISFETAWISKELVFRSIPIHEVFSKIERKYGVIIHLPENTIENDLYNGAFETEELADILDIFKMHYQFRYKIKGDEVYITFDK